MAGIGRMVKEKPVVLFMKGTPELPQCGFSRATVQILQLQGVDPQKFAAFNVLEDAELRQGKSPPLKTVEIRIRGQQTDVAQRSRSTLIGPRYRSCTWTASLLVAATS